MSEVSEAMSKSRRQPVTKPRRDFGAMSFAQAVHYRLPLAGFVSIFHRVSGGLMFLLLPFTLYMLDQSLLSENSFEYFKGIVSNPFVKLLLLALVWAYLHHFLAGVRHLFMDMHMGLDKDSARKSAVGVFALSLPLTLLVALKMFGAF